MHNKRERALPRVGLVELFDSETGETIVVDTFLQGVRRRFSERSIAADAALRARLPAIEDPGACHVWRGRLAAGTSALERAAELLESSGGLGAVGARSEGAMWSLLGLASCFEDRVDDTVRLLDRARGVIPAEDGYTRCLVAATSAMADQLADEPATVREAVEPVWSLAMDLGSDFWFSWAQALLGWAIAADDAPAGLAMMTETVDNSTTLADQAVLPRPARRPVVRARARSATDSPASTRDWRVVARTDERLWEPLLRLTRGAVAAGERRTRQASRRPGRRSSWPPGVGQPLLVRRHAEWLAARG